MTCVCALPRARCARTFNTRPTHVQLWLTYKHADAKIARTVEYIEKALAEMEAAIEAAAEAPAAAAAPAPAKKW